MQCVIAQLTASGQLQAVLPANLAAAFTGVLGSQGAAVTVLNNISTPAISGATFYVGYGATAAAMINDGINRSAVSVPGAAACVPSPPQTGWWFNPAEGGRGFSLEVQGNNIFFASFLMTASGRSTWYAATGRRRSTARSSTAPPRIRERPDAYRRYHAPSPAVASGAITSPSAMQPRRDDLAGRRRADPALRDRHQRPHHDAARQPAGERLVVEHGRGGRGYFIEWQARTLVAGYMYDASGNPLWYLALPVTPNPLAMQST